MKARKHTVEMLNRITLKWQRDWFTGSAAQCEERAAYLLETGICVKAVKVVAL